MVSNSYSIAGLTEFKSVMDVKEIALYLGVGTDTIYRMSHINKGKDGELPHFHIGKGAGGIRYYRYLVDDWIISKSSGYSKNELIALKKIWFYNEDTKTLMESAKEFSNG